MLMKRLRRRASRIRSSNKPFGTVVMRQDGGNVGVWYLRGNARWRMIKGRDRGI